MFPENGFRLTQEDKQKYSQEVEKYRRIPKERVLSAQEQEQYEKLKTEREENYRKLYDGYTERQPDANAPDMRDVDWFLHIHRN